MSWTFSPVPTAGSIFAGMEACRFPGGPRLMRSPRLIVEALQRSQLFLASLFLAMTDGRFEHADRRVVDVQRHRVGMPVLATVRE